MSQITGEGGIGLLYIVKMKVTGLIPMEKFTFLKTYITGSAMFQK